MMVLAVVAAPLGIAVLLLVMVRAESLLDAQNRRRPISARSAPAPAGHGGVRPSVARLDRQAA